MGKNKNIAMHLHENFADHKLVSRRDFLALGLLQFSATLIAPSLLSTVFSSRAAAQELECPTAAVGLSAFVTLNLAGGAALASNFVPMDQGGQLLTSYDKMGLGMGSSLPIERAFGNVPFAGNDISKILMGIKQNASAATMNKTAFVAVLTRLQDDSRDNKLDISGLVAKAGVAGSLLPNLGKRNSSTGVGNDFAKIKPPPPLIVGRQSDIVSAITASTGAMGKLSSAQQTQLYKMVNSLSDTQARKLASVSGGDNLAKLVKCATGKNIDNSQAPTSTLDPRANPSLNTLWNLANANDNSQNLVFSSMVYAALNGNSGTVGLEMGGYDYHNNTRTTGDQKDLEAGQVIGQILETASIMNKKVFIYVTTDGSVVSPVSTSTSAPWRSDRGSAGAAYMIAFDPAGRPATNGFQLGHFTPAQTGDESFITGGTAEVAASAVFANYLKFSGKEAEISKFLGTTFSTSDLDKIIKFG